MGNELNIIIRGWKLGKHIHKWMSVNCTQNTVFEYLGQTD